MAPDVAPNLARTLRDLREGGLGRRLTQKQVADLLGVSPPLVSGWESGTIPPRGRLREYAILFASPRWLEPGAPPTLELSFLTVAERRKFDELDQQLAALREDAEAAQAPGSAAPTASEFWRFPEGPVRVLCGLLDEQAPYSSPDDHNFMNLRRAADLDALLELHGHIRSCNPDTDVRFVLGDRHTTDDRKANVVILGNIAQTQGKGRLLEEDVLPIKQVHVDGLDGEVFEATEDRKVRTFGPEITADKVTEDVGLLARVPNPRNTSCSITICSGVFTRGVYGAVRCLTDEVLRDANAAELTKRLDDLSHFAVLMRVKVTGGYTDTPDLRDEKNWLFHYEKAVAKG